MVYVQMINIGQIETGFFCSAAVVHLFDLHLLWRRATCHPKELDPFFRLSLPISQNYPQPESIRCVLFQWFSPFCVASNSFDAFYKCSSFYVQFQLCVGVCVCTQWAFRTGTALPFMKCDNNSMLNCVIVSRRMNNGIKKIIELWLCHCFSTNFTPLIMVTCAAVCISKYRFVAAIIRTTAHFL